MDHQHERERDRGRTSRASSTSSLGREVRCACQFFQSDSLLPERRAMTVRPSSRNAARPPTPIFRTSVEDAAPPENSGEHEYEPIGKPLIKVRTMTPVSTAPVVRIIDTDVVPVADSDDSIDLRGRFTPGPILEGNDLILPLDGQIEDSAMEARELAGGGDTSEELESPQQLQDRLEERFFNTATPCTESRTDGEVNTSQVDSSAMEELPLRRGARGLPQRLRSQAGKLRSRLKGIQRPNFSIPIDRLRSNRTKAPSDRTRTTSEKTRTPSEKTKTSSEKTRTSSDKTRSSSSQKSEKKSSASERTRSSGSENKSPRTSDKRTRMERLRSSLPDRPKINFPDRPKFNFPDRSKFHLPERPKFNIKKPNIKFPTMGKSRSRAPSLGEVPRQRSTESNSGSRRNIFDFSTYPRLFDKKSKTQGEYATSSPNESRAQSAESSTLPRAKKTAPPGSRWAQKFTDIKFVDDEDEGDSPKTLAERSKPWRRPSLEEPRLSLRPQESLDEPESLPWEDSEERKRNQQIEELPYEEEELEEEFHRGKGLKLIRRGSEDSYDEEPPRIDPRLYGDQDVRLDDRDVEIEEPEDEESMNAAERAAYRASFMPVDPRIYKQQRVSSEPEDPCEVDIEEDEPLSSEGIEEDVSARSDREQQQSSGSSCDRRRRGVIEEIDSDEFFLREKGISQDDMNVGRYLTNEIRDALRTPTNALAHEVLVVSPQPPQRPARSRSMRKRKEPSVDSYDVVAAAPPARPKRDQQRRSIEYDYDDEIQADNADDSFSESHHRVVYHAESAPLDLGRMEPLDDIVVVKPLRRKSKSSLRSQSLRRSESLAPQPEEEEQVIISAEPPPPPPPRRRKRLRAKETREQVEAPTVNGISNCNGHYSPTLMEAEPELRVRTPAPKKPERATSRETLRTVVSRLEQEDVDSPPPVPPKRQSRSRGASVVPDDDRTSHGAESIPEIGYTEEDIPQDDNDSRVDYPGYAVIDKREKPPRPPPPRRRRDDKFATTPRSGTGAPSRPQRAYSTLRPARSRTPPEVSSMAIQGILDTTPYEELDSEEDEHRDLRSGVVVSKIQGRPLPAPPRPPRSRRERNSEDAQEVSEAIIAMEAFASTQTDPLPDDMVIEEEVTQAKLIVSPSRSGSQILVSTERIPSPTNLSSGAARSSSQGVIEGERTSSPTMRYSKSSGFVTEPPERSVSEIFERTERSLSPVRRSTAPTVPPLPTQQSLYHEDLEEFESREKERSKSPSLPRERRRDREEYEMNEEQRIEALSERMRLEEELDHARRLHAAILSNEPLKIASLEVGDLRVDRLSVSNLEAHKISASEIDALVVSATELSNSGETSETAVDLQPTLLKELIAIRSQLELANSLQEAPKELQGDGTAVRRRADEGRIREITYTTVQQSQPLLLQLDQVSRDTETRAIFSSVGSSRESSPQPTVPSVALPAQPTKQEESKKEEQSVKEEKSEVQRRSGSRSRSSSPGKTSPSGLLRQTTSSVKSLPPVISVTPDTPDVVHTRVESSDMTKPQRAVISYAQESEELSSESIRERSPSPHRPSSPPLPPTAAGAQYIAFSTSQIPAQFFSLASPTAPRTQPVEEPGVVDLGQQLFRALSVASKRAMRHFVGYIVNRIGHEETDTKIREVELALCALLLIIAGLLIVCFGGPRTVTHHHHWDYFNPPRL